MNLGTKIDRPRKLVIILRYVREGLPSVGRYGRYVKAIAPTLAAIWVVTAAYLLLAPARYDSRFVLILPGSGIGSSINVESIGQAQSSAASAFSSSTLSPTENYRQLLSAEVIRRDAAKRAGDGGDVIERPTIKLVDQTNLIEVEVAGNSPKQAERRAKALIASFSAQLDQLRNDEADARSRKDFQHLQDMSLKVKEAQAKVIAFQAEHGLATLDQFNARVSAVDDLRNRARELRLQLRQQKGAAERMVGSLQSGNSSANFAMRLRSDPIFQEFAQRYAVANADAEQKAATLGPNHPSMAQAEGERGKLRAALADRGRTLVGLSEREVLSVVDMTLADGRSNLMQAMLVDDARAAGSQAALGEIRGDLGRASAELPKLMQSASTLADLQRDLRVTEAILSSAMARLESNRQDPYASYPLVQVLAAPALPEKASSPSLLYALIGATAATIFTLLAFALAWLRQPILDRLLKNG